MFFGIFIFFVAWHTKTMPNLAMVVGASLLFKSKWTSQNYLL